VYDVQVALWFLNIRFLRCFRWFIECSVIVVLSAKFVLSFYVMSELLLEYRKMTEDTKLNWIKKQMSSGAKLGSRINQKVRKIPVGYGQLSVIFRVVKLMAGMGRTPP
jgi:hypothetical protein